MLEWEHNIFSGRNGPINFVTYFVDYNICHTLRKEVAPLSVLRPSDLWASKLHIIKDDIDVDDICEKWRYFLFSHIFQSVSYISTQEFSKIRQPILLKTSGGYDHNDFTDCATDNKLIRLTEAIKSNIESSGSEKDYVLLNQRPVGNRYLVEENTGQPLEQYLRDALAKREIPFKSCRFHEMTPVEQAQMCLGASTFISAHGAGCTNIIFTPLHCSVIEYNFRKYWNCDPVCDAHYNGTLSDNEPCNIQPKTYPQFHKADFHNLSHMLDRHYTELEVVRYAGYRTRNPIDRSSMYVDGLALLEEIEKSRRVSDARKEQGFSHAEPGMAQRYVGESRYAPKWMSYIAKKRWRNFWSRVGLDLR
ncbi:MAG: glycosyltransferase family 61 protein [Pseudomonadota bacterium]